MGDVSREQLAQIASNFLLNSPPGEFLEVVTDLRALLPDEQILNSTAPETFKEYNTVQMTQVQSPNNRHEVLITKYGEIGEREYLDPRGHQVITYDHLRQEVTGSRPISGELDANAEPFRAAIDAEAEKYAAEHYPHGAVTVYGKKEGKQYKITICISAARFSPTNFWNGRWRSTWQATFGESGQANLDGKLQVNVHYFEDGNVQLNTNTEKHLQTPVGDPAATASAIVKAIEKAEAGFHTSLDSSYANMSDTTFKALRRPLPITRTLIQWTKIMSHKATIELGRK